MNLSGAYFCFTTQGRLFCFPKTYFSEQEHIIFVCLFIKIYNNSPCSPKYDCNILLYSTLTEAEFYGTKPFFRTSTWLEKTHTGPWLPFVSQVSSKPVTKGVALGPMITSCDRGKNRNWILVFWIRLISIVSKNHVVKVWVEALTSYSTVLTFIHLFVDVFILSTFLALHKPGQPNIFWLKKCGFIT